MDEVKIKNEIVKKEAKIKQLKKEHNQKLGELKFKQKQNTRGNNGAKHSPGSSLVRQAKKQNETAKQQDIYFGE